VLPSDEGYEAARGVWDPAIDNVRVPGGENAGSERTGRLSCRFTVPTYVLHARAALGGHRSRPEGSINGSICTARWGRSKSV
jgi:hypothetical protein